MTLIPDPAVQAWLDQEDRYTAEVIRRHGTFIQYVGGDDRRRETSFAYTVGLFGMGHPELLVFGLCLHDTGAVLNELAARIRDGADLAPGDRVTVDHRVRHLRVEAVPNPGAIVFAANRFYQRPDEASVPVLQLTQPPRPAGAVSERGGLPRRAMDPAATGGVHRGLSSLTPRRRASPANREPGGAAPCRSSTAAVPPRRRCAAAPCRE